MIKNMKNKMDIMNNSKKMDKMINRNKVGKERKSDSKKWRSRMTRKPDQKATQRKNDHKYGYIHK